MREYSEAFVAFDVSKTKHAVAIAGGGRGGEVRFLGDISSSPATVERLIRKLAGRYGKLHFCYEGWNSSWPPFRIRKPVQPSSKPSQFESLNHQSLPPNIP